MGRGQSGYLYGYPFLLPLRGTGATGFAGVLCPRGNTPLLQQGEPDTHKQHQNPAGGKWRAKRGGEEREESRVVFSSKAAVSAIAHTGVKVCCPEGSTLQAGDTRSQLALFRAGLNLLALFFASLDPVPYRCGLPLGSRPGS